MARERAARDTILAERSQTLAGFSVGRGRDFQRCSEKRHRLPADAEHKYEYTGDCGIVAQGIGTTYDGKSTGNARESRDDAENEVRVLHLYEALCSDCLYEQLYCT